MLHGPVAVLIGPNTRNAGEDVTVALHGRPHTRFFGAPTAGFPDWGVRVHRLADGTSLGIRETRDADRTGEVHRLSIDPDKPLPVGAGAGAAAEQALESLAGETAALPQFTEPRERCRPPGPALDAEIGAIS